MVNKDFLADFRRMTGKEYSGCLTDTLQILVRHNLRYMWWYRRYCIKTTFFRKFKLHQFSRKYGLEIRPKQCGAVDIPII